MPKVGISYNETDQVCKGGRKKKEIERERERERGREGERSRHFNVEKRQAR